MNGSLSNEQISKKHLKHLKKKNKAMNTNNMQIMGSIDIYRLH